MSTRTDLGGILRYDEHGNFSRALLEGLTKSKEEIPVLTIAARWRDAQASSEATIVSMRVNFPVPAAVDQIVNDLEQQVQTALGPMPDGTLRIQAFQPGRQSDPIANIQRRLTPKVGGMDHDLSLTLQLLRDSHALNMQFATQLTQAFAAQTVQTAAQAQSIEKLATVRGAASAAADTASSGIWSIVALGAAGVGLPLLRKRLGLSENASYQQVIERMMLVLDASMQNPEDAKPPASALELEGPGKHEHLLGDPDDRPLDPDPEPVRTQSVAPDAVIEHVIDLDALLARAKNDPELLKEFVSKLKADDDLMTMAMSAIVGG